MSIEAGKRRLCYMLQEGLPDPLHQDHLQSQAYQRGVCRRSNPKSQLVDTSALQILRRLDQEI